MGRERGVAPRLGSARFTPQAGNEVQVAMAGWREGGEPFQGVMFERYRVAMGTSAENA